MNVHNPATGCGAKSLEKEFILQDKMRKIAIFTSSRAEYYLLRPLMQELRKKGGCEIIIIASGQILDAGSPQELAMIKGDGFNCFEIPILKRNYEELLLSEIMGTALASFGKALASLHPDLLVILGDRYEAFSMAAASVATHVPIAHIHGGELSGGSLDDIFRHAISKISLLHFTSCEEHRKRVVQLGEQPENVWNFGALGVENILKTDLLPENQLRRDLGIREGHQYFLTTLHPATLEPGTARDNAMSLLEALGRFPEQDVVFTAANADPEGNEINCLIRQAVENSPERYHFFNTLGAARYLAAAKYATAVVGNSSSGIIEIPSLGTPVINTGLRQKGRMCSAGIIHCGDSAREIYAALNKALSPLAKKRMKELPNPYEGVDTARKIAEVLLSRRLDGGLKNNFFDLPQTGEF